MQTQVYSSEHTMKENGALTINDLPFNSGETIKVIIIPRYKYKTEKQRYPLWGKPITYLNPTEPVAVDD
jgi:hypothetical protein